MMRNHGVAHCRRKGRQTMTVADRIEREIVVAAPADRLWEVLTRPEHIGRWFEGMAVQVDLRPGGAMVLSSQEFGKFHAVAAQVDQQRHADANTQGWRQVLDSLRRYAEQRPA